MNQYRKPNYLGSHGEKYSYIIPNNISLPRFYLHLFSFHIPQSFGDSPHHNPSHYPTPSRQTSFQVAVLPPAKYWKISSMDAMSMPRVRIPMEKFFLHRLQLYRLVKKPRDEYSVRWARRRIRPSLSQIPNQCPENSLWTIFSTHWLSLWEMLPCCRDWSQMKRTSSKRNSRSP